MTRRRFAVLLAEAGRARRTGWPVLARDLAEAALHAASGPRDLGAARAELTTLAVAAGDPAAAERAGIPGLALAEEAEDQARLGQLRIDLATAALQAARPVRAREHLALIGHLPTAALRLRAARLRAVLAMDGIQPLWVVDGTAAAPEELAVLRQALQPGRTVTPRILASALGSVLSCPGPDTLVLLAHLCAGAAACAEAQGYDFATERLSRLAYTGLRAMGLCAADAQRPVGLATGGRTAVFAALGDPLAQVFERIAGWARLYFTLYLADAELARHGLRVAGYARRLARAAGASRRAQGHALAAGLLHDAAWISAMPPEPSAHGVSFRAGFDPALATGVARRLGQPPAVVNTLTAFRPLGAIPAASVAMHPILAAVAVADVYDALTSRSPFRSPLRHRHAVAAVEVLFAPGEPHVGILARAAQGTGETAAAALRAVQRAAADPPGGHLQHWGPAWQPAFPAPPGSAQAPRMVLQPIVDLRTARVAGYEALARGPAGSRIEAAADLFAAADAGGDRCALSSACCQEALDTRRRQFRPDQLLFLNVAVPGVRCAHGSDCPAGLWLQGREPLVGVVAEISEDSPPQRLQAVREHVALLRSRGCTIALDDYGTAYAGSQMLLELHPDYLKFDMQLIHHLDTDGSRAALVASLAAFCGQIGIRTVAEGIETAEELRMVCTLGIDFGQGFFLAKPAESPEDVTAQARAIILTCAGPPLAATANGD